MIWLALVILLLCSGIVSSSETALFGLSRQALHQFGRSERHGRNRVFRIMQQPRKVLMTVLMANTAVNVAFFTVSFFALRQLGDASAAVVAMGSVAVLLTVIVLGEMLPKAIALSNTHRFAPPAAWLMRTLQGIFGPIQWLLSTLLVEPITRLLTPRSSGEDAVTTEELRLLVEHSARDGAITSSENEMLRAVVALGDVSVREVMTPRVDIRSVPLDADRATALKAIASSGRRSLPVYSRDLDDISGVVRARDLRLAPEADVKAVVRGIDFVPEQVNLLQLLRYFRTNQTKLAIVVDEYGGTSGLVSNEDVIEWIFGELPGGEGPRTASMTERIDENTYLVSGDLSVRAWADRFGVGVFDRHIDTVAGVILATLGRLPREGDSVRIRNLTLTVEAMHHRRIERVRLRRDGNHSGDGEGVE